MASLEAAWVAAAVLGGAAGYGVAYWRARDKIARLKRSVEVWRGRAEAPGDAFPQPIRVGTVRWPQAAPSDMPPDGEVRAAPQPPPDAAAPAEPPPYPAPASAAVPYADVQLHFSPEAVASLYARWCREGRRPPLPSTVRATPLRFAGSTRANDWTPPVHAFQDHPQMGEFVRFSDASDDGSCALPHPESPFSEVVHPLLFPQLTAADFDHPATLTELRPVPLRRRGEERTWEIES